MKNITNLIIIDASGSMASKAEEIRGGLRLLFQEIKADAALCESKIRTIVTQFSSPGHFKELVNSKKAEKLTDELANAYEPQGMTALFDAIGQGFQLVPDKQDSVLVTIMTDGEENSSQEYSRKSITELITKKRAGKPAWTITFMGTTEQAMKEAKSWGVSGGNALRINNNAKGFDKGMRSYSKMRKAHYESSVGRAAGANMDDLAKDNEAED
ncbi:VWA domain-containing protein [Neolewinella aurantiaca]|uniref:VWA domain-containing protein n=1 Tax=Neolewinella aurantiaca TaxID=2602767 RepID=A0A5C7FKB0_9BACT|nr:vWA domain-containing protein [Neolewinella aurantiaca]TXF85235.1 VWA domain-containing protein [Neolewinella aurantiaca]